MKHVIFEALQQTLVQLGYTDLGAQIILERPADMHRGDFSTSIALVLSKKASKSPLALAIEFVDVLREKNLTNIGKIEVAGPGFINFYVSRNVIKEEILKILTQVDSYGNEVRLINKEATTQVGELVRQKIAYEYTDPNPFKAFHIGHLMANTIGESLARIAETQGAEVRRFCYQGDVGRHVALTLWGLRLMTIEKDGIVSKITHRKEFLPDVSIPLSERVAFFGKAYALGATEYKRVEDESKKAGQITEAGIANSPEYLKVDGEVQEINKKIYDRSDDEINEIYDMGKEWSLEHFEELYAILGTQFDQYFFESASSKEGLRIVRENTTPQGKSIFEESNDAIIFPGEKYGLHTRVFVTRQGLPTYDGKEIGLAPMKYAAFPYDIGVTVTANEQDDFFKVSMQAIGLLYPELAHKIKHISHGMLRLTTGKMSSRTGDVITGEALLTSMIDFALEKMKDRDMEKEEKEKYARYIAVAAIKYTVLRQTIGKDIVFDPEKALSFEGDSGPYLQYACVRAKSVLEKAQREGIHEEVDTTDSTILESETYDKLTYLESYLVRFTESLERAYTEESPHIIANYLMDLAAAFNSFYASVPIVKIDEFESRYKVAVVRAFSIVMKNGLRVLGIQVPAKM
jgi:arginyl-tRNA synthetase